MLLITKPCLSPLPTPPVPLKIFFHSHSLVWSSLYGKVLPSPLGMPFHGVQNSRTCGTMLLGKKMCPLFSFFFGNYFHHLRMILQRLEWVENEQCSLNWGYEKRRRGSNCKTGCLPLSGRLLSF